MSGLPGFLISLHHDSQSSRGTEIAEARANNFDRVQPRICISKLLRCNRMRYDAGSIIRQGGNAAKFHLAASFESRDAGDGFRPDSFILSKTPLPPLPNRTIYRETIRTRNNSQLRTGFGSTTPLFRILLASFLYVPMLSPVYTETIENAFTSSGNPSPVNTSLRRQIVRAKVISR